MRSIHMGNIYEAMDRTKEQIKRNIGEDKAPTNKAKRECRRVVALVWDLIDKRWDEQLDRPLHSDMVIPPPVRPRRVIEYLRPYVLKMHFTNKYVSAQVIHSPTATVASSASSQEKLLRPTLDSHRDVAAAAKIGKILGERLLLKEIPAITVFLKRDQKYHGKVKAVIDSVREAGVKLV